MMYQDNYARQEVYCDPRAGENDYCTYMDPDMLLATCTQSYAVENDEPQWYNSTLSSPIDVQLQFVENMPLPPSPTDSLTFSPYSETISQQPSPIEGTFDYYSPSLHDTATPYDYFYYSQPSPLMEDHHHHRHLYRHHHQHDDGAMCPPQQPVYPAIIARQDQQHQQQQNLDNVATTDPVPSPALVTVPSAATDATATVPTANSSADSSNGDTMTTAAAVVAAGATANASTPVRPYPCYLCSRSFARKHDLQRHIRVHTGAKPYACLCCKKAFARTDALKRHLRMEEACRTSPEIQAMKCAGKRRYRNL